LDEVTEKERATFRTLFQLIAPSGVTDERMGLEELALALSHHLIPLPGVAKLIYFGESSHFFDGFAFSIFCYFFFVACADVFAGLLDLACVQTR
jgi:hypothetical protein